MLASESDFGCFAVVLVDGTAVSSLLEMIDPKDNDWRENVFDSLFPRRHLSDTPLESSWSTEFIIANPFEILHEKLSCAACFALVDLIASVLRLDFCEDNDNLSDMEFCSTALEKVLKYAALPERTNATVRHHLIGEGATDDIATFVTLVKNDPFVLQKGVSCIPACLLSIFIECGSYDCRYRVLLHHVCSLLAFRWDEFENMEDTLVDTITRQRYSESDEQKVARARAIKLKRLKRFAMIGAASSVGGVLIGVTGGLAAPFVATGAGVVIGSCAAAGIGTTAGVAVLGSLFGVAGAGLTGYKMKKRIGAVEEFVIQPISEGQSLHCVLAISGWINDQGVDAFHQQWRHLWLSREQYILRYESKYLAQLGQAIDYLMSFAVSVAVQHTLLETSLADKVQDILGLVSAVAWPVALLSASSVIDNPWNVCIRRAKEVGEHLAEVLLSRAHGNRPITLIGFSLGARVIFHCLMTMSGRSSNCGIYKRIINDVILLGAPVSASPIQWHQMSQVVGGRVINGYCTSDWLLRFIYRTMNAQFTVAGTGPVECKQGKKIANFNLSHIVNFLNNIIFLLSQVKGHLDYSYKLTEVLAAVGVKVTPYCEESNINMEESVQNSNDESTNISIEKERFPNNLSSIQETKSASNKTGYAEAVTDIPETL
ncbi:unnamed protein product [Thelazia callipaeda]|uniref:Transmembrane and coiled-coil domain-containing protein 4 n=1 Tax=Thelazia callipaeda TaxID=103827 RepID=A0A0N5CJJ4_THECL|nr:unnamed protein product [Thelazia callipaeda]